MNTEEIKKTIMEQVSKSIEEYFSEYENIYSLKFKDDLKMDSLDIVEMTIEIERQFNIQLPDHEIEKLVTVQDLYNLIEKHL